MWIGLYKKTCIVKDEMQWLDGTEATFSKFWFGDPNEEVCCIRTTLEGWKDKSCLIEYPFACKKPSELKSLDF